MSIVVFEFGGCDLATVEFFYRWEVGHLDEADNNENTGQVYGNNIYNPIY